MHPIRKIWEQKHEATVEKFYSRGAEKYGDFHGGYLNFGLWQNTSGYQTAAENMVSALCDRISLNEESYLLDVACGLGPQEILIHKKYQARIEALDVTWKHVQRAYEQIQNANLEEKIQVHHGTATELPFKDEAFTHLLCVEGAEHFNTREQFLKEAYRVLQPQGKIALADFVVKREPQNKLENFILKSVAKLWHVPFENYETSSSYRERLKAIGFTEVWIEEVGKDVIPGYYFEQIKKETFSEVRRIRGPIAYLGRIIDYAVYKAFTSGLLEYVLATAQKPPAL